MCLCFLPPHSSINPFITTDTYLGIGPRPPLCQMSVLLKFTTFFFFFFNFSQLKALSSSQKKREKGIHVRNTLSISLSSTQRTICPLVFSPLLTPQRMTETRAKNQERLWLARSSRLCLLQLAFPWQGSEMLTWGPEELYLTAQGPTPENYKKRDRRAVWIQLIQCKMCKGQN